MNGFVKAFLTLFTLVGLAATAYGCVLIWRDAGTRGWPVVPGRITHSAVKIDWDNDNAETYRPEVAYRYQVAGRTLDGTRISFGVGKLDFTRDLATQYVERYPVGAVVPVAYQPGHPETSVLERGLNRHSFAPAVGGLFFVGAGAWVYLPFDRLKNRPVAIASVGAAGLMIFLAWLCLYIWMVNV